MRVKKWLNSILPQARLPGSAERAAILTALPTGRAQAVCDAYEGLGLGSIWSTDQEGMVTYLSDAGTHALNNSGSAIGNHLCDLFDDQGLDRKGGRSLRLALSRQSRFDRLVLQSTNGRIVKWWSVSGMAQTDARGNFAGFLGFCLDITSDRSASEESEQMAMHDALTGLLNRRRMNTLLENTLAAYRSQGRSCATILIDLDRFKQVNDTLGHSIGDALLKQVADRLIKIVGDRDKVCRLGGDEFQIILPDQDDRGLLGELALRIISMVSQPYTVEGSRCIIGASVGIAVSPFDGNDRDEIVRNADLALYAAKHAGRGQFRFFSRELLRSAEERRMLEDDLHDAIGRGEFEMYYQPVVKSGNNRVAGAEALIRWNHPDKGMVSPGLFIPIAEESNLIIKIGEWCLRKGCEEAAQWPGDLRVAVNVSPMQFTDPGFPALVEHVLKETGLSPERLELEITEGVFLADSQGTENTFSALKAIGVRLALDDFGTGYSSLSYLKSAPFDKIKIDQSFVRGATVKGARNKAIIGAIVSLAAAIDMETTAEGIESFDQLQMLRDMGVGYIQGYIYSPAMSNADFLARTMQAEWGIEPSGFGRQRHDRIKMYRKVRAIHEDYCYAVVLRNLSASGALIEGLIDVPIGTSFVIDFGDGQLEIATVRRSRGSQQGVEFENELVNDGSGGLCTRRRVTPYQLAAAGLPDYLESTGPSAVIGEKGARISLPSFVQVMDGKSSIIQSSRAVR